jgi:hypothetical protein
VRTDEAGIGTGATSAGALGAVGVAGTPAAAAVGAGAVDDIVDGALEPFNAEMCSCEPVRAIGRCAAKFVCDDERGRFEAVGVPGGEDDEFDDR